MCSKHYTYFWKYGTPVYVPPTQAERFWSKVNKGGPVPEHQPDLGPCWVWTRFCDENGYGKFNLGGQGPIVLAHRFAWEQDNGTPPEGLDLDHLCRNPGCVRPSHLESVTHRVNVLRGTGASARNAVKTHCPKGHEYTPDNTYWHKRKNGRFGRDCRACCKARWAASR